MSNVLMMGVRQGFEFIQDSLTVYTCVKCPIVGQKFCVNAPSKAPLRPEGGWWGNKYIDRCITLTRHVQISDRSRRRPAIDTGWRYAPSSIYGPAINL